MISISPVIAQSYTSDNVYYYLPEGYSPEEIGESTILPYHKYRQPLDVNVLVDNGNSIQTSLAQIRKGMTREQVIKNLNNSARGYASLTYYYDASLSTSKRNVYKRVVESSMFGPKTIYYIALSHNRESFIEWEERHEDKRVTYCRIDIRQAIPSTPNRDFLND